MAWRDEATLKAAAQWLRLVTGAILVGLLIWMFADSRIDLETVIKALIGLLAVDRVGMAVTAKR